MKTVLATTQANITFNLKRECDIVRKALKDQSITEWHKNVVKA